jgi:hypothetical protein
MNVRSWQILKNSATAVFRVISIQGNGLVRYADAINRQTK